MPLRASRRMFLIQAAGGLMSFSVSGCGTVLHPERKGQPEGPLDWKIVGLNAVGLLLFLVPGVIAFAVDFSNGTIYLPSGGYHASGPVHRARPLTSVSVPKKQLSPERLERTVERQSGYQVRLVPGRFRTRSLPSITQFWSHAGDMAAT